MICDALYSSRLAGVTLGICASLSLACSEDSEAPDGGIDSGGRSGSGGGVATGGRGGQMSDAGTSMMDAAADADDGGSGSGGTGVISGCPTPAPVAVGNQTIAIQSIHFGRSEVVLENVSSTDQIMKGGEPLGWQWCNVPGYFIITSDDVVLAPGDTYKLHLIERQGTTRALYPGDDPGDTNELAIYDRSGSYTTPEFMLAFVSWGEGASFPTREPTAMMAGLWTFGERVSIAPGHAGLVATGATDRGAGYTSVPARCLPP